MPQIDYITGKANCEGIHVMQNKHRALQENVVSNKLHYMTRKQLINLLFNTKC